MNFLLLNLGAIEIIIFVVALLLILALGNYGRNTALGYWGSILLALVSTPIIAFIVISVIKTRTSSR